MSASSISGRLRRLNKTQKLSVAGISAVAAAALSLSLVPGNAEAETEPQAISGAPVVFASAAGAPQAKTIQASVIEQHSTAEQLVKAADAAKAKKSGSVKEKSEAASKTKTKKTKGKAKKSASKRGKQSASRSESRTPVFSNNLDGWIKESLSVMKAKGIPGTYDGLHRNIIRESSGNPKAINDWDVNAVNGVPSKGLLQIIKPTFDAYHVGGTPHDQYDPVANITASANYAADKYGSIDNVNSAY